MYNLVVLGCARSGTSMVAGALASSGYWSGYRSWQPDPYNPKGYFECSQLVLLNNELLAGVLPSPLETLGKGHPLTQNAPQGARCFAFLAPETDIPPASPAAVERITDFTSKRPFCLKDPQFSYSLEAWRPFLDGVRFVVVFRHPLVTARSMVKMCREISHLSPMNLDEVHALAVWRATYRRILERHSLSGEWYFIHYDQMFDECSIRALEQFTGASVDGDFPEAGLRKTDPLPPLADENLNIYQELCARAETSRQQME